MEKILNLLFCFILFQIPLKAKFIVKSYYEIKSENLVRQQYEKSCGASSLATLINNIDFKHLSENDILEKMDIKRKRLNTDMISFYDIKEVAKKMDYNSQGYQIDRKTFEKLNIPVLVKIEDDPRFPHFVVAINHIGDFVTILDPSFGRYESLKSEFYSVWDKNKKGGFILIIESKNNIKTNYSPVLPTNKSLFDILR